MAFIRGIIGTIVAIALAAFCVMNAQNVEFKWSPLHEPIEVSLYLIILATALIAFLTGACLVWFNSIGKKRIQKKHIKSLEKELKITRGLSDTSRKKTIGA